MSTLIELLINVVFVFMVGVATVYLIDWVLRYRG